MSGTLDQAIIDRAVAYHGSLCPGLAVGVQAARLALREVGRASEENRVVAVAETDINRNNIHDWGKNAFTSFPASDSKAVRLAGRPAWASDYQALRTPVHFGQAAPEEVARFGQANAVERPEAMAGV